MESEKKVPIVVVAGFGVILAVLASGAFYGLGYHLVRSEPKIMWLNKPLDVELDPQGKPGRYIIIGADDKGIAHIGFANPPAQPPVGTLPGNPNVATKPKPVQPAKR